MSEPVFSFPTRFRGYDREAVDLELQELRAALEYAHADRDRAVARALALEHGEPNGTQTSATVKWLIETAEQDARRIREEAEQMAAENTERAEELLRHRVALVEQAQHEADVCRARAAEEAREIVHAALEKSNALLQGLSESESGIRELFASGVLAHRMPPPRRSHEQAPAVHGKAETPSGAHVRTEASEGDQVPQRARQTVPAQQVQPARQAAQQQQPVPAVHQAQQTQQLQHVQQPEQVPVSQTVAPHQAPGQPQR